MLKRQRNQQRSPQWVAAFLMNINKQIKKAGKEIGHFGIIKNPLQYDNIVNMQLAPQCIIDHQWKCHKSKLRLLTEENFSPEQKSFDITRKNREKIKVKEISKKTINNEICRSDVLQEALKKRRNPFDKYSKRLSI